MKLLVVSPRQGALWVREGLQSFRRAPMAFFSLFMLFMTAVALLAQLPLVGNALAVALGPAMTLALMAATERVQRSEASRTAGPDWLKPSVFLGALAAVRERAQAMLVLGLIYALLVWLSGELSTLLVGDPMASAFNQAGEPQLEVIRNPGFVGALALRMLLYLPVALAFWHAPALVHWHGVAPVKSLFFSLVTCLRNFGALLVFGLCWMALALVLSLLTGVVSGFLSAAVGPAAASLLVGMSLLLSAMFLASCWFSFRDSFQA